MSIITEGAYLGDLVKREADDMLSREKVTILAGELLSLGEVVGKITRSCPTTGTAAGGNTGNGTCGSVTMGIGAKLGTYTLTCTAAVTNAGVFQVKDPDGFLLPPATVAVAYASSALNFTIADGSTDFVVGDSFTVAVSAGSGKVKALDLTGVDGSQDAHGIAIQDYAAGTLKTVAYTSGGTYVPRAGDKITGATSGATAVIQSISLTSGTFAGGDAAGAIIADQQIGTFAAENLNIGSNANVATIGGNPSAYSADRYGVAIVRDAVIDPAYLVWPSTATADQKAAALARLKAMGVLSDRPAA